MSYDLQIKRTFAPKSNTDAVGSLPALNIPIVPPRVESTCELPIDTEDRPNWFYVKSPREEHGVVGPVKVEEIRVLYKYGDVTDHTLVWEQSQDGWHQIQNLPTLRHKIVSLPLIPPKLFKTFQDDLVNPLSDLPTKEVASSFGKIPYYRVNSICSRCSNFSATHVEPLNPHMLPQLTLRQEVGSSKEATEILRGFLFIGNSSSAKPLHLNSMGFTLLINTNSTYVGPNSRPPYYRCKDLPMHENPGECKSAEGGPTTDDAVNWSPRIENHLCRPTGSVQAFQDIHHPKNQTESSEKEHHLSSMRKSHPPHSSKIVACYQDYEEILSLLDKSYHWIEWERTCADRNVMSDETPTVYHGTGDRFGRPPALHPKSDRPIRPKLAIGEKVPPSRVLLWSRLGFDRPCTIAVAYLVRRWNMSVAQGMEFIKNLRPGLRLCPVHLKALAIWERKYLVGNFLCVDCLAQGLEISSSLKSEKEEETNEAVAAVAPEHRTQAQSDVFNLTAAAKTNESLAIVPFKNASYCRHINSVGIKNNNAPSTGPSYQQLAIISICGQMMTDEMLCPLLHSMLDTGILCRLYTMELKNNLLGDASACLLAESLLHAVSPNASELTSLDISHNRIALAGATKLAEYVKHSTSLIHLNVTNNKLTDEGASYIILALVSPEDVEEKVVDMAGDDIWSDDEEPVEAAAIDATARLQRIGSEKLLTVHSGSRKGSIQLGTRKNGSMLSRGDSFNGSRKSSVLRKSSDAAAKMRSRAQSDAVLNSKIQALSAHNSSIVDLRVSENDLGLLAAEALVEAIKHTENLTSVHMDGALNFSTRSWKHIFTDLRLINCTMERVSFADSYVTIHGFECFTHVLASRTSILSHVSFARCGITAVHMEDLPNYFSFSTTLKSFDLSGNPLGEAGGKLMAQALTGPKRVKEGRTTDNGEIVENINEDGISLGQLLAASSAVNNGLKTFPLQRLDFAGCSLTLSAAVDIMEAVSKLCTVDKVNVKYIDFSNNKLKSVHPGDGCMEYPDTDIEVPLEGKTDIQRFCYYLSVCQLTTVKMNDCCLGSLFAHTLVKSLIDTSSGLCGATMKSLMIATNDIHDSIFKILIELFKVNTVLREVDLGFNKLTSPFAIELFDSLQVASSSSEENKFLNLNLNLVGNDIRPSAMSLPDLARSKTTTRYMNANIRNLGAAASVVYSSGDAANDTSLTLDPIIEFSDHVRASSTSEAGKMVLVGEEAVAAGSPGSRQEERSPIRPKQIAKKESLVINDYVPISSLKHFSLRKKYLDQYQREKNDGEAQINTIS